MRQSSRWLCLGSLGAIGRYIPVLHLHGRVGWYRRDNWVYAANITKHQEGLGVPIVMLPDPTKVYDQDDAPSGCLCSATH